MPGSYAVLISSLDLHFMSAELFKDEIPWAFRPDWEIDDHDGPINIWIRTADHLLAIVMDLDFQALVAADDEFIAGRRCMLKTARLSRLKMASVTILPS